MAAIYGRWGREARGDSAEGFGKSHGPPPTPAVYGNESADVRLATPMSPLTVGRLGVTAASTRVPFATFREKRGV